MKLVVLGTLIMQNFRHDRKWLRVLPSILALVMFAILIYFWMIPSQAMPMQKDLEKEFLAISPLPKATLNSYESSYKDQLDLVEGYYSTALSYNQIRNYYVGELEKNGWQLKKESELRDISGDHGGKVIMFCKGNYRATLDYAGISASNGWTYVFNLSWGLLPGICNNKK